MDDLFNLSASSPCGSPSDSEGSLNKNISSIISMLHTPTPGGKDISTPQSVQDTQPVSILKGVIAYVEVRSRFENRNKAITHQLEQLGATVVSKFDNEVTHVIFKEGKKSTREKARKRGIHLVSVLWIEACRKNEEHVAEKNYPANIQDDSGLPMAIARLKKSKSMQPKDFDEELASSAEKVKRRIKMREKKEKWKILETPITPQQYNRNQFYVAETQPMSPGGRFFSPNISVPETPPSMRRKIEALRKKKALQAAGNTSLEEMSIQESPVTVLPGSPLQKRLFGSTSNSPTLSSHSSVGATPLAPEQLPDVKFSLLKGESPVKVLNEMVGDVLTSGPSIGRTNTRRQSTSTKVSSPVSSPSTITMRESEKESFANKTPADNKSTPTSDKPVLSRSKSPSNASLSSDQNQSKSRSGKRKLMKLDDNPVEKILSPMFSTNAAQTKSGILDIPKRKRSTKASLNMLSNTNNEPTLQSNKRKAPDTKHSSSDSSPVDKKEKKSKPGSGSKITLSSKSPEKIPTATKAKRRSMAVTPIVTPRNTRRRSCMPSINSPTPGRTKPTQADPKAADSTLVSPGNVDIHTPDKQTLPVQKNNLKVSGDKKVVRRKSVQPVSSKSDPCPVHVIPRRSSRRSSVLGLSKPSSIMHTAISESDEIAAKSSHRVSMRGEKYLDASSASNDTIAEIPENESSFASTCFSNTLPSTYNQTLLNLTKSRRSIEEFVVKRKKKKTTSLSSALDTSSSDEDSKTKRTSRNLKNIQTKVTKKKPTKSRKNSGSSSDGSCCAGIIESDMVSKKGKAGKTLVTTSLHYDEQDMLKSVVKKLGGFTIAESVNQQTSHIVCGNNRRTINILMGISCGCWILSLEWVFKSLEAGEWLPEETFEQKDIFPAGRVCDYEQLFSSADRRSLAELKSCRLERAEIGLNYKGQLFSENGLIFVAENTAPPHSDLVRLLKQCGAQVTHCVRKAKICIGQPSKTTGVVAVLEKWILDSITSHKSLPFDKYKL